MCGQLALDRANFGVYGFMVVFTVILKGQHDLDLDLIGNPVNVAFINGHKAPLAQFDVVDQQDDARANDVDGDNAAL